jgi:C-terminal processing protease CtpA/Prc
VREVEIALHAPPEPQEPPDAGPPHAEPGTIGASLRGDSEMPPTVVSLIPDGPAEKAGVELGDQISAVDGKSVTGVSEAVMRIRGAPGTPVQLAVQRAEEPLTFTIIRAP